MNIVLEFSTQLLVWWVVVDGAAAPAVVRVYIVEERHSQKSPLGVTI